MKPSVFQVCEIFFKLSNLCTSIIHADIINIFYRLKILPSSGIGLHTTNGSPVNPVRQEHTGVWRWTLQVASTPHTPSQGFRHFLCIHAWLVEHSESIEHSGLQLGGVPIYVVKQAQDAWPWMSRHSEKGPQGEGAQRFTSGRNSSSLATEIKICLLWFLFASSRMPSIKFQRDFPN